MSRIEWGNYAPQSPGDNHHQSPPERRGDRRLTLYSCGLKERTWQPPERTVQTVVCSVYYSTSCVTERDVCSLSTVHCLAPTTVPAQLSGACNSTNCGAGYPPVSQSVSTTLGQDTPPPLPTTTAYHHTPPHTTTRLSDQHNHTLSEYIPIYRDNLVQYFSLSHSVQAYTYTLTSI